MNAKERIKASVLKVMEVAEDMKRKQRKHARPASEELGVIPPAPQEGPQQEERSEDLQR